jgi:hypothetical protein
MYFLFTAEPQFKNIFFSKAEPRSESSASHLSFLPLRLGFENL